MEYKRFCLKKKTKKKNNDTKHKIVTQAKQHTHISIAFGSLRLWELKLQTSLDERLHILLAL